MKSLLGKRIENHNTVTKSSKKAKKNNFKEELRKSKVW